MSSVDTPIVSMKHRSFFQCKNATWTVLRIDSRMQMREPNIEWKSGYEKSHTSNVWLPNHLNALVSRVFFGIFMFGYVAIVCRTYLIIRNKKHFLCAVSYFICSFLWFAISCTQVVHVRIVSISRMWLFVDVIARRVYRVFSFVISFRVCVCVALPRFRCCFSFTSYSAALFICACAQFVTMNELAMRSIFHSEQ